MPDAQAEISLLGQSYTVRCTAEEAKTLTLAAQYLDNALIKIQQQSAERRAERVALMAALNIAHELLSERAQLTVFKSRAKQLTQRIESKMEQLSLSE